MEIYHYRNHNQSMWQKAVNRINHYSDDQLIWFTCNDDHIFIDNDLNHLDLLNKKHQELLKDTPYVSCFITHWPELLALRVNRGKYDREIVEDSEKYFVMNWKNDDGTSIINKGLLKYWWFENDYGEDAIFRRTDDPEGSVICPEMKTIVPYREQARHFDGYDHVGINPNECPPLFIPAGFFKSQIKISSCNSEKSEGYVLLDVKNNKTKAFSEEGVDLRCFSDDVPLFWNSRISETLDNCKKNYIEVRSRNKAIIALACSDKRGGFPPIRVVRFLKHSYFNDQNLFLVLIDSLFVWRIFDYRVHFTFIFRRKFPRLFKIIYKIYLKLFRRQIIL